MILFPAIDLKDGQCVRLLRGDINNVTVFGDDPAQQARQFVDAGCEWLHVVDLNGAFTGTPVNEDAVRSILAEVEIPVQLGGGIRTMKTIERWIGLGVRRVILGTVALRDPAFVKEACQAWPGRIAVGIDARGGKVAVEGWAETSNVTAHDLALLFEDAGVSAIIHTDIERDGAMQGVNIDASRTLAEGITTPVIVSGGVTDLSDIRAVKSAEGSGIVGVISGRALYDGTLDLGAALGILK
ncbi:1-(5-phosphoribosyl)-5-[(5-phosphoribosylamino)methylideneamino]imidazole-4-carboxamide isomerase [Phaeovibrio sulfidiphilus]|uniref:1-(5-phosphoribosyl)-5-[(5-phosphoribosylamino)methylideneamino] imidazole-4-carboxamide isomerase n=1 Tax=Phaeovibrio sulfidiphilus TaxID=1220600 RepID=A0A8J6YP36_9PROT|nr:1-(5-phosphoribosyl)-5-[(5-phosphoribosylamino)methylideneamino]imidazole-4-carboxamide isomerase [Phaeovibrio sulfidiphilus]MBE1236577.1 1-(5-phosphoribosyl)-5-[(5-phosphoribosylamino)methylideneamino]imidazole-4-carboxamide isomerase [Phaeovibrio sulfidiphilus]